MPLKGKALLKPQKKPLNLRCLIFDNNHNHPSSFNSADIHQGQRQTRSSLSLASNGHCDPLAGPYMQMPPSLGHRRTETLWHQAEWHLTPGLKRKNNIIGFPCEN